jgi:hypothetical protein
MEASLADRTVLLAKESKQIADPCLLLAKPVSSGSDEAVTHCNPSSII